MKSAFRTIACLAALGAAAGCSPYGLKGDRGLPPPSETIAYPNLNEVPTDRDRRLRSPAEQRRITSELLARKPARR